MKTSHITRRLLCLLLAVVLVASIFAGLTMTLFAAAALPSANTKVRHIVCTSLSSQATAYYGSGQYSYAQMSQLSGVDNAEDCWATTQNNPLYDRLQTLMSSTHSYKTSYSGTSAGSLAYYWERTDAQNSSSTYYCFYSDLLYGSSGFPSDMQREHIWPKSNASFYQINGGSDLHHLRPSVGSLNNSKSNKSFGEMTHDSSNTKYVVSGDESTVYYSGTYFEPKDDIKGDVARILLYVYCRWGQPNLYTDVASSKLPTYDSDDSANNGTRAIDGRAILLKWLKNDPVDTWEMERNDRVQDVQGNRNVFIDYPEYAWLVFGLTPPSDMTTPSGMAAAGSTSYTVNATSNNTNYGTVSVSGTVITASPKNGYYASGYQVTSGSASVSQNGNTFTVTPSSDCTVQIIFAAKTTVTISYFASGSSYNPGSQYTSVYAGEEFTLPTSATAPSGWEFVGWTTNGSYTDDATAPTLVTTCTPTGATSFYAVYSQTSGSGGTTNVYVSTAAADVNAGQYVIGALRSDSATNNYYFATSTISSGDINTNTTTLTVTGTSFAEADLPSGAVVFTFTGDNTNGFTIAPSGTTNYLGFTAASNRKLAFDSAYSTTKWQAVEKTNALNTNGLYLNCTSGTTYAISENSTAVGAIRGYSSGTAYRGIYLFKLTAVSSGTTTYSINPSGASHEHTMDYTAAEAATCTAAGHSAYYYCSGCGRYFADIQGNTEITLASTEIAALGHDYQGVVTTAATCGAAGVMTYTCSRCQDSYTETIPATGNHNYTDVVTNPTASAAGYTTHTCSVCGDSYVDSTTYLLTFVGPTGTTTQIEDANSTATLPSLNAYDGWTFSGWVKNTYDNVTTAPSETVYTTTYPVTNESVTFYALYTKTETTGGSTPVPASLTKLSTSDTINDGDKIVIVAKDTTVAMYQQTQSSSYVAVWTFDNNVATVAANDKNWLTFTKSGSDWVIGDDTNGYLYNSNNSNNLSISSTQTAWTLSTNGSYFRLKANNRYLSYRSDLSNKYWRMGGANSGTSGVVDLDLYRYTSAGAGSGTTTTTYTTQFNTSCAHPNMEYTAAAQATCTEAGNSEYYFCPDCGKYFSDAEGQNELEIGSWVITATGHAYGAWTHVDNSDPSQHQRVCANDNAHIEYENCTFGEGVVTVQPSYTSAGVRTYTCPDCGYSYTETIPAIVYTEPTGDTYELLTDLNNLKTGDKVVIYNPANTKAMTSTLVNTYYLSGADATISGTTLTPADETAVWTVTKNQDGTYTFTQDNDVALYGYVSGSYVDLATASGENYINKWSVSEVDSTNHKYSILCDGLTYTKSSTTYNSVYLEYFNSRFALYGNNNALTESDGAYLMQFYVYQEPAIEVKGVNLTLDGVIDTNAYIAIPDSIITGGVTAIVTTTDLNGNTVYLDANGAVTDAATGIALSAANKTNGMYKFTAQMPAKEMNTKVRVELRDADNQLITFRDSNGNAITSFEYCVQDYLETVIGDQTGAFETAYPGLTALCKAMSNYGSYAQVQQNYHTDIAHAIYQDVLEDVVIGADAYNYSVTTSGSGIIGKSASVVMLSETAIRMYFRVSSKDATYYATATCDVIDPVQFTVTRYDDSYYMVEITGIPASELSAGFTVTLADQADVANASNKVTISNYSVYSYVKQALKNTTGTDDASVALRNVAQAIYIYGEKAAAYFN